jgi:hypothetical protein
LFLEVPKASEDHCGTTVVTGPVSEYGDGAWSRLQLRNKEQYLDADHCGNKLVLNAVSVYADGACQLWKFQ